MRGSRVRQHDHRARVGSIPACAGEPGELDAQHLFRRVHPRVCGGAISAWPREKVKTGPSPRVRGSLSHGGPALSIRGSIPACAGEPCSGTLPLASSRVHPRVCGGARCTPPYGEPCPGPSPRVRGSHSSTRVAAGGGGSIPACAGEPGRGGLGPFSLRVHPRVCGGACATSSSSSRTRGPSPRVRGSPEPMDRGSRIARVHPRVCGGARRSASVVMRLGGPSPRVRGSRLPDDRGAGHRRSIPACAGEPRSDTQSMNLPGVHPRVCGGAHCARPAQARAVGPSPRVRGSPSRYLKASAHPGSIPACAGEPPPPVPPTGVPPGPSPRVRGSPDDGAHLVGRLRSIPACAGEPSAPGYGSFRLRVHPRVCGGAAVRAMTISPMGGPSPRVRGSRIRGLQEGVRLGSIPACAGEPC